jgi:hypothetical protein
VRREYKIRAKDPGPHPGPDPGKITEMAIVNTFTKLIFGDEAYTPGELAIIAAFRSLDGTVARDTYKEMGEYLRNLGVREMIHLVSSLRQQIADCAKAAASSRRRTRSTHSPRLGAPAHGREAH